MAKFRHVTAVSMRCRARPDHPLLDQRVPGAGEVANSGRAPHPGSIVATTSGSYAPPPPSPRRRYAQRHGPMTARPHREPIWHHLQRRLTGTGCRRPGLGPTLGFNHRHTAPPGGFSSEQPRRAQRESRGTRLGRRLPRCGRCYALGSTHRQMGRPETDQHPWVLDLFVPPPRTYRARWPGPNGVASGRIASPSLYVSAIVRIWAVIASSMN